MVQPNATSSLLAVKNNNDAVLDSGATSHFFNNLTNITNYLNFSLPINTADGAQVESIGTGDFGILRKVFIVPSFTHSLVSTKNLTSSNNTDEINFIVVHDDDKAYVLDKNMLSIDGLSFRDCIFAEATLKQDGLYHFDNLDNFLNYYKHAKLASNTNDSENLLLKGSAQIKNRATIAGLNPLEVLHVKLGHASESLIKWIVRNGIVNGLGYNYDQIKNLHLPVCDACMKGKMKALPVPLSVSNKEYSVFELLSLDIIALNTRSIRGFNYSAIYVDKCTTKVFAYHMPNKTKLLQTLIDIIQQYGHYPRAVQLRFLQSDFGSESLSNKFLNYLYDNHIILQTSAPYKHQQNLVERYIYTLKDGMRTIMSYNNTPRKYWCYALDYYCYTFNNLPRMGKLTTRDEDFTGVKSDMSLAVPFYSNGYYNVSIEERKQAKLGKTFSPKAIKCRFIGYAITPGVTMKNTYLCLEPSGAIKPRHDCYFQHYTDDQPSLLKEEVSQRQSDTFIHEADEYQQDDMFTENKSDDIIPTTSSELELMEKNDFNVHRIYEMNKQMNANIATRVVNMNAFIAQNSPDEEENSDKLPKNLPEALKGKDAMQWYEAFKIEMDRVIARDTYTPILDPNDKHKSIKSKFAFKIKYLPDGSVRYKMRLCACGYSQVYGRDYVFTFSPTAKYKAYCILMHLAAIHNWFIKGIDVENAYLETYLDYDIYMTLPTDVYNNPTIKVKLNKSLYGLKQSGELWYKKLNSVLISLGFKRLAHDTCIYSFSNSDSHHIVNAIIYVDDIIFTGDDELEIDNIIKKISTKFKKITINNDNTRYIGVDNSPIDNNNFINLSQIPFVQKYADNKNKNNISTIETIKSIPISPSLDYSLKGDGSIPPIQDDVGKIRYMADRTRPDLLVAAGILGSGAAKPHPNHIKALNNTNKYISSTSNLGVKIGGSKEVKLFGFSDASYIPGGDSKSRLGYCFYLNLDSGTICARSRKDTTVSHSSMEAELKAIDDAIREAIWMRGFLKELNFEQHLPTIIHTDNLSAKILSDAYKLTNNTSHIVMRLNFIHQEITAKTVSLKYIDTDNNVADILTKPLAAGQFIKLREKLLSGFNNEQIEPKKKNNKLVVNNQII